MSPGVQELVDVANAALGGDLANLGIDQVLVTRHIVPAAQDADGGGEAGQLFHLSQQECVGRVAIFLVVDEKVLLRDAVAEIDHLEVEAIETDALLVIFAEDERLAVFEVDDALAARIFFGEALPGAVIEDVAVLQDLDIGRALVSGGVCAACL